MAVQGVVDLPQTRRNVSPQKPAVSAAQPSEPSSASPAEPAGHIMPAAHAVLADEPASPLLPDHSLSVPSQTQRPFSSRPDGPIGWIEPDEPSPLNDSEPTAALTAAPAESASLTSLQQASDSTPAHFSTSSQAGQPSTSSSIESPVLGSGSMHHAGSNPGVASQVEPECDTVVGSSRVIADSVSPAETANAAPGTAKLVTRIDSGLLLICCCGLTDHATPVANGLQEHVSPTLASLLESSCITVLVTATRGEAFQSRAEQRVTLAHTLLIVIKWWQFHAAAVLYACLTPLLCFSDSVYKAVMCQDVLQAVHTYQ